MAHNGRILGHSISRKGCLTANDTSLLHVPLRKALDYLTRNEVPIQLVLPAATRAPTYQHGRFVPYKVSWFILVAVDSETESTASAARIYQSFGFTQTLAEPRGRAGGRHNCSRKN